MKFLIAFLLVVNFENQHFATKTSLSSLDDRKYCYTTYNGKYEISLTEGGGRKATYKLYNMYGDLQKTMQGVWVIKDQGVYGPAHILTISWTGLNSNMPSLKFVCQYDENGRLQGIIDSQNRTWNQCHI